MLLWIKSRASGRYDECTLVWEVQKGFLIGLGQSPPIIKIICPSTKSILGNRVYRHVVNAKFKGTGRGRTRKLKEAMAVCCDSENDLSTYLRTRISFNKSFTCLVSRGLCFGPGGYSGSCGTSLSWCARVIQRSIRPDAR